MAIETPDRQPAWTCPVCDAELERFERRLACAEGHSFDIAKEGYVNLLLPQHKKSADPGDGPEMMRARRAFLSGGHYDFLGERIAERVRQHGIAAPVVLDAGCGEGHYLAVIERGLGAAGIVALGIDISRPAVRMAARQHPRMRFAVASTYRLPLPPASVDVVAQVFAPGDPAEYFRVLRPGGLLLIASPGPRHLFQIKQHVYAHPREHAQEDQAIAGFSPLADERLQRALQLTSGLEIASLLGMTPLYWSADPQTQVAMADLERFEVELDFRLRVWRRLD